MLQAEIYEARLEIERCQKESEQIYAKVEGYSSLLSVKTSIDPVQSTQIKAVNKWPD